MGIFAWIILGGVAGALAKWIMPGDDPGGFFVTIIIGIAGALVGGFVAKPLGFDGVTGFNLGSIAIAIVGALVLLFAYRMFKSKQGGGAIEDKSED